MPVEVRTTSAAFRECVIPGRIGAGDESGTLIIVRSFFESVLLPWISVYKWSCCQLY